MRPYILIFIELIGIIAVVLLLSISPALKIRRPVQFTQPRREGILAVSVAVLIILFSSLAAVLTPLLPGKLIPFLIFNPSSGGLVKPNDFSVTDLLFNLGYLAVIFLPVYWVLQRRKQPWLSVGLKREMIRGGLQLGTALALITIFLRGKVFDLIQGPYDQSSLFLVISLIGYGFVQEIIFRGFIQLRFESWLGQNKGWLAASLLNAIWITIPLVNLDPSIWLSTLIYRIGFSILLGWILRRSGSILGGAIYQVTHIWIMWI